MLPGFTADRVFDRPAGAYATAPRRGSASGGSVRPQRVMSPYGPIGLPGQNHCEVCWHMCMSFGIGGYERCSQTCAAACSAGSAAFGMLRAV